MKRKLWLLLLLASFSVLAQQEVVVSGAAYLESGEEIFHVMDSKGFKAGDVVIVRDKKDASFSVKARVKNVGDRSLVLLILPAQ